MKRKHLLYGNVLLAIAFILVTATALWLSVQNPAYAWGAGSQSQVASTAGLGTAFTYQGSLMDGGLPANGTYDLKFSLYDALTGGNPAGSPVETPDVAVNNGIFTVKLDFGENIFTGDGRFLEVGVRPGDSSGAYTTLNPRHELTAVPYALNAATVADGAILAEAIGEPCAPGQVLTSVGGEWTCGGADVAPAPQQQVNHTLEIGVSIIDNVVVDLTSLNIGSEVIEYQDGDDPVVRKRPGRTKFYDFFVYCIDPDHCGLTDWHDMWWSGDIAASLENIRITINDQGLNPLLVWFGFECWPSQNSAQYSPDGSNLFLRFKITCNYFDVDGSNWARRGAPEPSPERIDHRIEIDGNHAGTLRAELSSLDYSLEVIEYQHSDDLILHKRPGISQVKDFFVYCKDDCRDIIDWYNRVIAGTVSRAAVDIHILAPDGSTRFSWNGGECWPRQHTNQLSPDGLALYPRFKISCETMQISP